MNKQVAKWLREAAEQQTIVARAYHKLGWSEHCHDAETMAELFEERATQVEAMTCDGCEHWGRIKRTDNGSRGCISPHVINVASPKPHSIQSEDAIFFGPKFGCIHWEAK